MLAGQTVESEQQSVFITQQPAAEQLASPSRASAPAPSIPSQTQDLVPAATAIVANQPEPESGPEASVVPQAESLVGDLVVVPETDSAQAVEESSSAAEELASAAVEATTGNEELSATQAHTAAEEFSAAEEIAEVQEISPAEGLAAAEATSVAEELADAGEASAMEQLKELSATQELAITESSDAATTKSSFGSDSEQPKLDRGELALETLGVDEPAATIANDPVSTNEDSRIEVTQSTEETKTEIRAIQDDANTEVVAAPVVATAPSTAKTKVAKANSAPVKFRRSTSYGGWMFALLPLLGISFNRMGCFAQKKTGRPRASFRRSSFTPR